MTGAPCAKRHKVVYNQLTFLLATGMERSSQAIRDLPQEDRIVQDIKLLGELCADDLPEEEASDPAVIEAEPAEMAKTKFCRTLDDMYKGACAAVKARQRRAQEPPRNKAKRGSKLLKEIHEADLSSLEAFKGWLECNRVSHDRAQAIHIDDLNIAAILDEKSGPEGVPLYLVRWVASHVRHIHVPALKSAKVIRLLEPDLGGVVQSASDGWQAVQWDDIWVSGETLHGCQENSGMFRAFMLTKRDAARADTRDGHLSNADKQGHVQRQQRPSTCTATDPALLSTVQIDPLSTHNPDLDIVGTGKFSIMRVAFGHDCAVHSPSGQTIATLHKDRLNLLHAAYRTGASEEKAGFEAAVAGLLMQKHSKKTQTFALPSDLQRAFTANLHLETELCALTFQPELDSYYSEYAEDAAFGANLNIYATAWTGASLCIPPEENEEISLAIDGNSIPVGPEQRCHAGCKVFDGPRP